MKVLRFLVVWGGMLWAATVLQGATLNRDVRCAVCAQVVEEGQPVFVTLDRVELQEKFLCSQCKDVRPVCFLCALPIKANARDLGDGRYLCERDGAGILVERDEILGLAREVPGLLDQALGRFLRFPSTNVQVLLESRAEMARAIGSSQRMCPSEAMRPLSLRAADGKIAHTLGLLGGLPRSALMAEVAHGYAHLWLADNVPAARRLHHTAVEGFCDLVARQLLADQGQAAEAKRIAAFTASEGQLEAFEAAKASLDWYPIVEWMKYGADDRLLPGDVDRVRRLDERLLPARGEARQVIPPAPAVTTAPATLVLNGISGTGTRRLALVNNATLAAGDTAKVRLANKTVSVKCVEIKADSVVLQVEGEAQPVELRLKTAKP